MQEASSCAKVLWKSSIYLRCVAGMVELFVYLCQPDFWEEWRQRTSLHPPIIRDPVATEFDGFEWDRRWPVANTSVSEQCAKQTIRRRASPDAKIFLIGCRPAAHRRSATPKSSWSLATIFRHRSYLHEDDISRKSLARASTVPDCQTSPWTHRNLTTQHSSSLTFASAQPAARLQSHPTAKPHHANSHSMQFYNRLNPSIKCINPPHAGSARYQAP